MRKDPGIATLVELHDQIIDQDNGYWIKIEAWQVAVSQDIPHGIRYSLTLHEPYGKRILGYDNAHAVKPPKSSSMRGLDCRMTISIGMLATRAFLTSFATLTSYWPTFSKRLTAY
jgi:hypothetical protein